MNTVSLHMVRLMVLSTLAALTLLIALAVVQPATQVSAAERPAVPVLAKRIISPTLNLAPGFGTVAP